MLLERVRAAGLRRFTPYELALSTPTVSPPLEPNPVALFRQSFPQELDNAGGALSAPTARISGLAGRVTQYVEVLGVLRCRQANAHPDVITVVVLSHDWCGRGVEVNASFGLWQAWR
jgi:hypothetical protein